MVTILNRRWIEAAHSNGHLSVFAIQSKCLPRHFGGSEMTRLCQIDTVHWTHSPDKWLLHCTSIALVRLTSNTMWFTSLFVRAFSWTVWGELWRRQWLFGFTFYRFRSLEIRNLRVNNSLPYSLAKWYGLDFVFWKRDFRLWFSILVCTTDNLNLTINRFGGDCLFNLKTI